MYSVKTYTESVKLNVTRVITISNEVYINRLYTHFVKYFNYKYFVISLIKIYCDYKFISRYKKINFILLTNQILKASNILS